MRHQMVLFLLVGSAVSSTHALAAEETLARVAPIRQERAISVGASLAWPWVAGHDVTVPLPALRVGVNVSPRLAVDLTGGMISYGASGRWSLVDIGARWFLSDGHASPYLMARVGDFFDKADEGSDRSYPYAAVGVGLEYACGCGFIAWGEAGPALTGYTSGGSHSAAAGIYASAGLGFRFGAVSGR